MQDMARSGCQQSHLFASKVSPCNAMLLGEESGNCGEELPPEATAITAALIREMITMQGYRCALSGELLTEENASLDHIVPISEGGQHTMENVHWVHEDVNSAKGVMSLERFVALCHKVAEHTPPYRVGSSGTS